MQAAVKDNIAKVPRVATLDLPWQVDPLDGGAGYDPCQALSYVVLGVPGATASSPYHIMLFHRGKYLGTATAESYGFWPNITRNSPSSITVEYQYIVGDEPNAAPQGRATATFTWNEAQRKVVMTGTVPPPIG